MDCERWAGPTRDHTKMRVALIGYGKMGHEIEQVLIARGHTVGLIIDADNQHDLNVQNLQKVDMAIEFSTPDTAFDNIIKCLEAGIAVVCGTTAWLDKFDEVVAKCEQRKGAFFYASNYSVGVNLLFRINKELARLMDSFSEYDVTLNEVHHTQKKDAPSGTAITLAEGILNGIERKTQWHLGTTTEPSQLEVTAQRRSVVPGIHTVVWESPADTITIEHTSKNRSGLAVGAVLAAEYLMGKKGVYNMNNLLFDE